MEAELLAAYNAAIAELGEPVELYALLNRLPPGADDRRWLDELDEFLDRFYRAKRLYVRGHRWLAERPATIRGDLVGMFDRGHLQRVYGRWRCAFTSHITVL
jgi:hypothetical protein